MISGEKLAEAGFKYIGRKYEEMDCQAFVEKCMADCGLKRDLSGSNTWYRKMDWTGTPEECRSVFGSIPKGAFLYILEHNGLEPEKYRNDGIGNASHIGIKTGRGKGAIHSGKSAGGVAESVFQDKTIRNGGWNRIGLWMKIDYGESINARLRQIRTGEEAKDDKMVTYIVTLPEGKKGNTVNLRASPTTSAKAEKVNVGTEVRAEPSNRSGWMEVETADGKHGYMDERFLKAKETGSVLVALPYDVAIALQDALNQQKWEWGD